MEVLVFAANSKNLFDVVMSALQSAHFELAITNLWKTNTVFDATPASASIEILSRLPPAPEELHDHQLLVSRKRLDRDSVRAFIKQDQRPETSSSAELTETPPNGPFGAVDTSQLLRKIGRKSKKIKLLSEQVDSFKAKAQDAMQKAQHLEMEQEQFFDDVQEMKNQFDKLAENHRKLMWEYLPARDPSLRAIPRLTTHLPETATTVGKYPLEQVLGYGQYAVVYTSSTPERELAIKAIDKQKLMDLVSLHRISSEITSLSDAAIRHPGILELVDVIHTHKHVYLVTERGGKDLFELFGAHTDGLGEDTIRPLFLHLAQAVEVLHRNNYCHRDLKPENVLYAPESSHLVKLIDFGLCTKATTQLHDFCGSPGFFAPELLLHDGYDGCKADVWSIGCILLELVLGNTLFSSIWMSMYDISILKEPKTFGDCVKAALTQIRDFCQGSEWKYSPKLRSALLGMLCENPSERLSIHQVLTHPWQAVDGPPPASHSRSSLVKAKMNRGLLASAAARISVGDSNIHPLPQSLDYPPLVFSAPGSPRVHHLHSPSPAKLNLPSLSPEKLSSRCPPERKTPAKLAFSVTRV